VENPTLAVSSESSSGKFQSQSDGAILSRKVLIAGASGLVGFAAARHFSALPDWEAVAVSRRIPQGLEQVKVISVDLLDEAKCAEVFGAQPDVTHLIYAALYEKPGLIAGWRERDQMEVNLRMLRNLFEPLAAAATRLQHVTLLQGTKAYGSHIEPVPVPARERLPRHPHENFYWLQEDYLRAKQQGQAWHWTILRPQVIFGESLGSPMNAIPAIGVYGAILKEAGEPLYYPGGPQRIFQAVDADLLARACAWAATSAACRNETFNINNGEPFEWRTVWPAIADALGMAPGPARPMSLAVEMPRRQAEWAAIVRKYRLRAPESLVEFVGQSFIYTDRNWAYGQAAAPAPTLVSTVKARLAGFHDCVDTEEMFRRLFRRYQELRWLPPL
jgi:nucleoside-diphosphate-sugar epimerase